VMASERALGVYLVASLGGIAVCPRAAGAQTRDLRADPALDITVTGIGAAAWVASELFEPRLAPTRCRWCEVDGADREVREALVWSRPDLADALSNVSAFALAPLAAVGLDAVAASHEGALGKVPVDAMLVVEAAVIATDVNMLAKILVGRERPFVHALAPEEKDHTSRPFDNNASFFSGHATETFALAAAAGTLSTMRGYRWAPLVWGTGGAVAAVTGYLRIAADRHWLTDVVVGALVGSGIGIGVPLLFHRPEATTATATATGGLSLPPPRPVTITIAW
jgi:membrane-associated phospholipid phosphatase